MARPSNREERREDLVRALEAVLAEHGLGGATVAKVADEAGVAPGLVHHHFEDREDLMRALARSLLARFRHQLPAERDPAAFLAAYVEAAVALRPSQGKTAARAWVGLFAEAVRSTSVRRLVQRALQTEVERLESRFAALGDDPRRAKENAAGLVAGIIGCLVFGAVVPNTAVGFAAPFLKRSLARHADTTQR